MLSTIAILPIDGYAIYRQVFIDYQARSGLNGSSWYLLSSGNAQMIWNQESHSSPEPSSNSLKPPAMSNLLSITWLYQRVNSSPVALRILRYSYRVCRPATRHLPTRFTIECFGAIIIWFFLPWYNRRLPIIRECQDLKSISNPDAWRVYIHNL